MVLTLFIKFEIGKTCGSLKVILKLELLESRIEIEPTLTYILFEFCLTLSFYMSKKTSTKLALYAYLVRKLAYRILLRSQRFFRYLQKIENIFAEAMRL